MTVGPLVASAGPRFSTSQGAISNLQAVIPGLQPPPPDPQRPQDGRWTLLNAPPARSQHTAVWDPTGEQMLVFGGSGGSGARDIWSYRPATDRWSQLAVPVPAGVGLSGQSAIWDPVRGQFIIFGGLGPGGSVDLWSFRPTHGTWVDLAPSGARPQSRAYHSAVWDAGRDQMLVFAGLGSGFGLLNDLWAYRPATNSWVQLEPPRPRPLPVFYHSAVWDPASAQMLVFGGSDPFTGQLVDELWSFSIETGLWTEIEAPGRPPGRLSHTAIWEPRNAEMIVFGGGCGAGCFRDDLWSYRPSAAAWAERPAIGPFAPARGGHTAVWDPIGARLLVFGGSSPSGAMSDLWAYRPGTYAWSRLALERPDFLAASAHRAVWDPTSGQMLVVDGTANRVWSYRSADNTWTDRTVSGLGPPLREDFSALWDPTQNGRLLLFGGYGQNGYLDDLWGYRPEGGWARLSPTGASPPGRVRHTAVWDSRGGQMLIFGGYRDGSLDDLWSYRPADNTWRRLFPAGPLPPARDRHSAVWHESAGRMLIFGGSRGDPLADLWSYDPASNAWAELTPRKSGPPTHFEHGAVWDPVAGQMLVFGGYGGRGGDDLWSYQPATGAWRKLRPWGTPPPARGAFSIAWDSAAARMLVVSAYLGGRANDLWAYRPASNAWLQPGPSRPIPSARQQHAAAWNPRDGGMLLFGGYRSGAEFLNDLWSYRPATRSWIPLAPSGTPPSARSGHSAVWDNTANRLLIFGGYGLEGYRADLWSYRPDTNTWEELGRTGPRPPPREEHSAVWDAAGGQMLVYGGAREGRTVDDLWAYGSTTDSWVELDPEGDWPAARFRHTAVWDATDGRMLVFAGYGGGFPGGYLNDVWSYRPSANTWDRLDAPGSDSPQPRARHVAVWDPARGRMLAMGGFAGGIEYLADLWSFDPGEATWQQLRPAARPGARSAHVAVWDTGGGQMLVHGGSGSALSDELWSYILTR